MKMTLCYFIALLLSVCSCQQQEETSLLWEISGNGLTSPSYLFGTWHGDAELRNPSFLDSVPGFHKAFGSAEQFVWEGTNLKGLDLSDISLPKDSTYADFLNEEEISVLDSILLKRIKVKSPEVNINPTILSLVLSEIDIKNITQERIIEKLRSLDPNDDSFDKKMEQIYAELDPMDIQLEKDAKKRNLSIIGLDSIIDFRYLVALRGISKEKSLTQEAQYIIKYYNKKDSIDNAMETTVRPMRQAYRKQNIHEIRKHKEKQLETMYSEEFTKENIDKFMQAISVERNIQWMQHIPSLITHKPSFIAVGAGHLPHKEGLINLLREQGYTVKAVTK